MCQPARPPGFDRIAAANQIAAYVAGIHGRKNLIWIGTPLDIMRDGGYSWDIAAPPDMTYVHRLMDTYDRFTQEQIAIYPLDPHGVKGLGFNNLRVEEIAGGTGGAAFYNTNDLKPAVAKIVDGHLPLLHRLLRPLRAPPRTATTIPSRSQSTVPGLQPDLPRRLQLGTRPVAPDSILKVQMTQSTMVLGGLPASQLVFDVEVTPSQPRASNAASPPRTRTALNGKSAGFL